MNEWQSPEHAIAYLERAGRLPDREAAEAILLAELPQKVERALDLGAGDGRLLNLVLEARPGASGVAADFSPLMLERLNGRFNAASNVEVIEHDLANPLPALGTFDVVVSGFAIHHVTHERKRALYAEVCARLHPGGVFANLEHVASPSAAAHDRFLDALGITAEEEDQSNKLLDAETQLNWLRQLGFEEVDCYWKWRELALLIGRKPKG